MSSITLDAEIILNMVFGSPEFWKKGSRTMSKETVEDCSVFIANNLPGYVVCDLSEQAILDAAKDGNFSYDPETGKFTVGQKPDRDCYGQGYPKEITEMIKTIVDHYLQYRINLDIPVEPVRTLFD